MTILFIDGHKPGYIEPQFLSTRHEPDMTSMRQQDRQIGDRKSNSQRVIRTELSPQLQLLFFGNLERDASAPIRLWRFPIATGLL